MRAARGLWLLSLLPALWAQAPVPPAAGAATAPGTGARAVPTFTEDVAPIVFRSCAPCHRPDQVAPFPLLGYEGVKKHGKTIRQVVADRFMPPWHPEPGHGEFRNCLRLPDADVRTITQWVDAGMPEGRKDALPPLPEFPSGWHLGEPDLVLTMERGFDVPAAGRDIYRNFVLPLALPQDRWVTAIEVRPSARSVLHHVLFFLDDSGEARGLDGRDGKPGYAGMRLQRSQPIGGWAVGGLAEPLPDGLALHLPRGQDLVLQSHFHPSGKPETERISIGLYFAAAPPKRTLVPLQLPPLFGFAAGIDIPAGDADWRLRDEFTLPCDVDAVTVGGHAHMLCRSMRLDATLPDGRAEPLLFIRNWDFDWQNRYTYRQLVRLPKGAVLHAELVYDNSADNPNNPNRPPKRVRWGRESTDEMGAITLMVVPADERDAAALQAAVRQRTIEQALERAGGSIQARMREYDRNGDGKVTRDEVPARLRRLFDFLDADHDGCLSADEFARLLAGRRGG